MCCFGFHVFKPQASMHKEQKTPLVSLHHTVNYKAIIIHNRGAEKREKEGHLVFETGLSQEQKRLHILVFT